MSSAYINLGYLIAAVLFIFGLKGLTHPRTAVRGNLLGALAMLVAVVVTLLSGGLSFTWIAVGLVVGAVIGATLAIRIQMTDMPQLVAIFNGLGGGASVLVAGAELIKVSIPSTSLSAEQIAALEATGYTTDPTARMALLVAVALSGLIGAITFSGSLIAFAKLQELKSFKKPLHFPGQQAVNTVLGIAMIALAWWMVDSANGWIYLPLVIVALALGVLLVMPIGGADMPVVIALLNSYSGLAAAATGFVINNNVLIIAGSLVGASGIILTQIMCKAMNRSLTNVLFGVLDQSGGADGPTADEVYEGKIKSTSADEVAMMLEGAQRVVVVPGYGLAVAQAQHTV
ncbi:MAG: NAD(P)(+) transhydrogenase (Re/Si-specific) subunit beta, partial [Pirellulales bacterium]|nr:NAD(P)(+) transhydrogenase (Re/Si-specific) subunit beta [Pirellulales bacterium]